ncbi:type VI secretion system lipoprotein TssJ [Collimonas sp. H4R21]|jgi:type VI secretion system protein VasD|uniref:Type VI secretion system lipoprotein TssJ n=1 Tax=Collimonas rhizosphaerae TaxID=3126357 RepID=A0ABU9PW48_9BURK|nr:type VI secretion system lipoprotein TssJ [Collimonas sp. OK412]SFC33178.1 type VI secretion system protein VasD [Collimonas sp. OK412]
MRPLSLLVSLAAILSLAGCAAGAVSALGSVASSVLEMSGITKPEVPDAQKPPRTIAIKLHAGSNLNADSSGTPLALVARVYKLRQNGAFQQATYDTFTNPQKEKDVLGADLLEVKEITLVPGQRYEVSEKVTREAGFVGVVALFRKPAAQRWKMTFPTEPAEKSGITIGANACALTVGTGVTVAETAAATKLLTPAPCG